MKTASKLIIIALLALLGIAMNSLTLESVTFRDADSGGAMATLDPPYVQAGNTPDEIAIAFYYRGYGNTTLRLTPRYCFSKGYSVNGHTHPFPDKKEHWCQELIVDLLPDLHDGLNTLNIIATANPVNPQTYSPNVGLTIGQPLFDENPAMTAFAAILVASLLALVWLLLSAQGFDRLTCLIFLSACACFLECLYAFPQFAYTLDLEKHILYIQHMSEHFFRPQDYTGPESWHPPVYYMLCALVAKAFDAAGFIDVWTAIRLISLSCYATFLFFGLKTIARVLHGLPFYLALSLLVFWPSGMFNAAWVFNDVLIYPLYAAAFYHTLVWYEEKNSRALGSAIMLCGIAFAVKTTALVPAAILAACIAFQLLTKRCAIRDIIRRDLLTAYLILAIGLVCNFGGPLFDLLAHRPTPPHLGGDGNYVPTFENFFLLDIRDLLAHPFFIKWDDPSPWAISLKTTLFTNTVWRFPVIAGSLMLLYLLMLSTIAVFALTLTREKIVTLFPLLAGFAIPFAASVTFMLLCRMGACMDLRYIQPALICIVILSLLAVQEMKKWPIAYCIGNAVAATFPALSILFFYLQVH